MFIVFIYSRNDVIYNSYQQKKQDWPFVDPRTSIEPTSTIKYTIIQRQREREVIREKLKKRYNVADYLSLSGRPVKLNGPHMISFNGDSMSYVEGFMAAVMPTMTAGIP